jgi:hypothetical protein
MSLFLQEHQMPIVYSGLDSNRAEIRVMRILAPYNSLSSRLDCSLETISLDAQPTPVYVALSYVWGPVLDDHSLGHVYLNGTPITVTANLLVALIHLSTRCAREVPFWIDAISINQADLIERGQQVQLMQRIYMDAFHVWAWQIPISGTNAGMDFIEEAGAQVVTTSGSTTRKWPSLSRSWLLSKVRDPEMTSTWESVCKLLIQPYWRRNWIIQELFFAQHLRIICGSRMARMGLLFSIIEGLSSIELNEGLLGCLVPENILSDAFSFSQIALLLSSGRDTLPNILGRFANSMATDPRDKIYSVLGLVTPHSSLSLPVDYTIQWPEVFTSATTYIIESDGNLDILATSASGSVELASWIPNFANQSVYTISTNINKATPDMVMVTKAGYAAGGNRMPLARFSSNLTRLTVKVLLLHTISYILPRRHFEQELGPVQELTRRLRFLLTPYFGSPEQRVGVSMQAITQITAYICLRFYEATFPTSTVPQELQRAWSATEFVDFALKCVIGDGRDSDCTPVQLHLLSTALSPSRSLFFCELEQPFSNIEDFNAFHMQTADIDPDVIPTLARSRFLVPGYCRNQEGWGQNGDIVCIVLGCNVPLLLRPVSRAGEVPLVMRVISEAYVYGVMKGEALGRIPVNEITLV